MVIYLGFGTNPARGYWDHGMIDELLEDEEVANGIHDMTDGFVVIPARHQGEYIKEINQILKELNKCVVVLTGDEESVFPWRKLKHPNMKVAVMHPRVGMHDEALKLPNGYRPETRDILRELGRQEKVYDWSFAGQITHDRRTECANILRDMPNGQLTESAGFGQGLEYREYLKIMSQSKVVACPSGPETPDSFRVYEALEAGCIPVVDSYSPNNPTAGFWSYLLGDIPFPIIDKWSSFPALLEELLKDWPLNANKVVSWWLMKKRELKLELYG